jgi:hypothetical protein
MKVIAAKLETLFVTTFQLSISWSSFASPEPQLPTRTPRSSLAHDRLILHRQCHA